MISVLTKLISQDASKNEELVQEQVFQNDENNFQRVSDQRSEEILVNQLLDNERSEDQRSEVNSRYNLRNNPPRTSETNFNSKMYSYSFFQYAQNLSESMVNTIDCVTQAWNNKDSEWSNEGPNVIADNLDLDQTKKPSKKACLDIISKELKRLTKGQHYHRHRLQKALINLCQFLLTEHNENQLERGESGICLTQMSAQKGIKMFGEKALEAMIIEYEQFENLSVFTPIDPNKLTWEEKKQALNAIDLIKLKRSGKVKGRTVADGRKQRSIYSKEEVSSPALSQDGFFASLAIDALERRFIATSDVAGAFLKANME